ncbi:hypothetical protein GCM10011371_12780 [Novosphingobium marinum]|uniref:Glycosyltransferase involved in cell wall biosynthesis n=1 Tax=Novosphingobium marinum TaxID=1514948 RepID=A0A7Y9XYN1_9SPHN|nr:glycosyltransferase [Novosphingobium marinum]NYH95386.1 glycosyltransferase involved in cell wall biosynthesis [Novosphingobium marinum]GGC26647.1 hypothetical protein GCM10011371_12780 [Novosphingobium marinum]
MSSAIGTIPGVTAIIPAYNAEKHLEKTLRSVLAQTYENLDVIVVDDGSTDSTAEIVSIVARQHDRVCCDTIENQGVAAAQNRGLALSQSRYVAFLDADDLWHPQKIEKQVAALLAHGDSPEWAACYTYYRRIDDDDRVLWDGAEGGLRGDFLAQHLLDNHVGNGSSLLVRRDLAIELGGFDPEFAQRGIGGCEDFDLQLRILRRHRIELVPEFLVGYRTHAEAMSNDDLAMGRGIVAVVEKLGKRGLLEPAELRSARFAMRSHAIVRFARAGAWGRIAGALLRMFSIAPLATIRFALSAPGRLSRRRTRLSRLRDQGSGPDFASLTPTQRTAPQ